MQDQGAEPDWREAPRVVKVALHEADEEDGANAKAGDHERHAGAEDERGARQGGDCAQHEGCVAGEMAAPRKADEKGSRSPCFVEGAVGEVVGVENGGGEGSRRNGCGRVGEVHPVVGDPWCGCVQCALRDERAIDDAGQKRAPPDVLEVAESGAQG